ncbi:MAG: DUF4270 domain-containing protein [Flavobacteriales bacterium]|nr:DUF4270 domain-containing protein [Flavobacteriales bacterium]
MHLKNSLNAMRLFSFLAVVVFAVACKRPETDLGLELQPEGDLLNAYYTDTTTLWVSTVREDTLRTDELSTQMLGNYADDIFGQTLAGIYTQIRLSGSSVEFPEFYEVDSVILSLAYSGRAYGKLFPQYFEVYEMTEDIYLDSTYYSDHAPAINNTVNLVEPGFEINELNLFDFLPSGDDSLVPQLQLRLKNSLAQKFFDTDAANLADNEFFLQFFKGLHIRSASANGAVVNFDLTQSASKLTVYYRDTVELDTTSYSFVMGDLAARFTNIQHSYVGSELAGLTPENPLDGSISSYVQAGASAKTKIELPFLDQYNVLEGRTINKAELIVPVEDNYNSRLPVPSQLFVLGKNDEDENIILPDQVTASHDIDGIYMADTLEYRFNITRWVQQVLNGEISNNGLQLVSNSAGVSINRVELHGPDFNPALPEDNMRLLITLSN